LILYEQRHMSSSRAVSSMYSPLDGLVGQLLQTAPKYISCYPAVMAFLCLRFPVQYATGPPWLLGGVGSRVTPFSKRWRSAPFYYFCTTTSTPIRSRRRCKNNADAAFALFESFSRSSIQSRFKPLDPLFSSLCCCYFSLRSGRPVQGIYLNSLV